VPYDGLAEALTHLGWRQGQRDPISALSSERAAHETLDILHSLTTGPRSWRDPRRVGPVEAALARDAILPGRSLSMTVEN
jgi:hypothetical protein